MARPVALGLLLRLELAAAIADEHRLIALPRGLETEIVVDPAVREEHVRGEGLALEIMTRIGGECIGVEPHFERREHRREGRGRRDGLRQRDLRGF